MRKSLLSFLVLFSIFFASKICFASSFDCSFSRAELSSMTPNTFDQLSNEKKAELAVLHHAGLVDDAAAELILLVPVSTRMRIRAFSQGVPPFVYAPITDGRERSARGIAFRMTLSAIAQGLVVGLVTHGVKTFTTGGF